MSVFTVKDVKISGIATCVPAYVDRNADNPRLQNDNGRKIISTIGVSEKRIADAQTCSSDLCFCAAQQLLNDMQIEREQIDCLIFVSQTPDYIYPATSCILQHRLGLSKECHTIDISLGCSGWVYGLSMISTLMSASRMKKGLLLVGDTTSKLGSKNDDSYWPLFGDAGTATLVELDEGNPGMTFHTASDGEGADAIMITDGGYRNMVTTDSLVEREDEEGNCRNRLQCKMKGMDVFSFAISKVPKSVKKVLETVGEDKDHIDAFLFHQANKLINETIRKKLKLTEEQVPYSLEQYGNSSCASIPQTMCAQMSDRLASTPLKLIACAFGVGLSWATVYFETNKIYCPPIIEYKL